MTNMRLSQSAADEIITREVDSAATAELLEIIASAVGPKGDVEDDVPLDAEETDADGALISIDGRAQESTEATDSIVPVQSAPLINSSSLSGTDERIDAQFEGATRAGEDLRRNEQVSGESNDTTSAPSSSQQSVTTPLSVGIGTGSTAPTLSARAHRFLCRQPPCCHRLYSLMPTGTWFARASAPAPSGAIACTVAPPTDASAGTVVAAVHDTSNSTNAIQAAAEMTEAPPPVTPPALPAAADSPLHALTPVSLYMLTRSQPAMQQPASTNASLSTTATQQPSLQAVMQDCAHRPSLLTSPIVEEALRAVRMHSLGMTRCRRVSDMQLLRGHAASLSL